MRKFWDDQEAYERDARAWRLEAEAIIKTEGHAAMVKEKLRRI
jgi:hypothetical protein